MLVADLIEQLKQMPRNHEVWIPDDEYGPRKVSSVSRPNLKVYSHQKHMNGDCKKYPWIAPLPPRRVLVFIG